jgi:hypothetical protein
VAGSVAWSKVPDDDRDEAERQEAGEIDESFAARRLRRWIEGMFGGAAKRPADEPPPPEDEPQP